MLASVAAQAGLRVAWLETPEDTFCRVVAHIVQFIIITANLSGVRIFMDFYGTNFVLLKGQGR